MAVNSSLLPLLRRISRPYVSIQKFSVLAASTSRLFHSSVPPMQSILCPELGRLQRIFVLGLFKSGSTPSICRNYARGRTPVSKEDDEDDEDSDEDSDAFENDVDESDEDVYSDEYTTDPSEEE